MKNVLVTGGAGFIGSNFIQFILENFADVSIVNLDLLTYAGCLENLVEIQPSPRYSFVKGDICDMELVHTILVNSQIDTIVHFAAETHVDRSIVQPEQFIQTNIVGTFTLLEAARSVWLGNRSLPIDTLRFHHVSTDEVYGTLAPDDPDFSETTPYSPNSPYAASKAAGDHLVRAYFHTYGLPVSISNCSNNYGPRQFPEKLIPLVSINAINGKAIPVYGDGMQIRDWLYVEDHCDAITRIITRSKVGQTYNIGGNNQQSNLQIINQICALLDDRQPHSLFTPHRTLIQHVADRPGHDRRYAMNIQKISSELDWYPKHDIDSGIKATVDWYLDHPNWLTAIQKQKDYQSWLDTNYSQRGSAK